MARINLSDLIAGGVGGAVVSRLGITTPGPYFPPVPIGRELRGIDEVDDRFFTTAGAGILQSTDRGATWSSDKGVPSGVTASTLRKFVRFGAHIYTVGQVAGDSSIRVYRASPAAGNSAFSWSASLLTLTDPSGASALTTISPMLNKSAWATGTNYLFVGDYGDPTGGPSLWRSPDGTTWTKVLGPIAGTRHFHCVYPDPFRPGHVWLTSGDGQAHIVYHSTDSGSTWTLIETASDWQAVQISSDDRHIFFAGDSRRCTAWVYRRTDIDEGDYIPLVASTNSHWLCPVPGAMPGRGFFTDGAFAGGATTTFTSATANFTADDVGRSIIFPGSSNPAGFQTTMDTTITAVTNSTTVTLSNLKTGAGALSSLKFGITAEKFYANAFYGAVDPDSGVYFCIANDVSAGGNRSGLFMLPEVGGRFELVEVYDSPISSPEMYLYEGYLYMGTAKHKLLELAPA